MVGLSGHDIAVDLGTTTTLVYVRGRGVVVVEPSLLAVDSSAQEKIRAVGSDAERLLEAGHESVTAARPLQHGVITNIELAAEMLRWFIRKATDRRLSPPRVVASVPSGATGIERNALSEACRAAGARPVCLIEKPLAAAIGAGLPVGERVASLLLDVGGGTSEAAVISMGEIVVGQSIRFGSGELDRAIINHFRREHGVLISERTAERIKRDIGSAATNGAQARVEIRGYDSHSQQAVTIPVSGQEIRGVLERPVARIIETVTDTLARTPPELGADVIDCGLMLAGGGSLLHGLRERLREETQLPVQRAEMPLTCVVSGSGICVDQIAAGQLDEQEITRLAS